MTLPCRSRLLAALVVAAAAATGSSCDRPNQPQAVAAEAKQTGIPVTVARVIVQPSARLVNFVGTLYGNEEVTLSSQVEGQIESLTVDLGDPVDSGQLLAQIDDDLLRARLRQAEATLAKAQADEARGRQLLERRVISAQEYESMKTQATVAQAVRERLVVTIRHARVESPIRGAVAKRFVSVGEYVRPGSQLFSLVAEDPLKLRGDVPERFAHELRTGQPVRVHVDAAPDREFAGRLTRISPASNPENRSITIEAVVENHEQQLKPGFFANAAVVTRSDDPAVMVPQEAVIAFAGITKLFVIRDSVAHERRIHTGTRGSGGLVEVLDGVEPDEVVAVSGLTKLENGRSVTIKDAGMPEHSPTP
jgi:membrane fusion protein (multidrug efflux system)